MSETEQASRTEDLGVVDEIHYFLSVPVVSGDSSEPATDPVSGSSSALSSASALNEAPNSSANPACVSEEDFSNRPRRYRGTRRAPGRPQTDELEQRLSPASLTIPQGAEVYVGIETVEGLGDSVLCVSSDYGKVVGFLQDFARRLGEEIFDTLAPGLSLSGTRLRDDHGKVTRYKIILMKSL